MIVKRKTRKAIQKSVKKVIKKHGPKVVAGLAGSIASALAALASTEAAGSQSRKSNLTALSQKVTDTLTGESDTKSRRKNGSGQKGHGISAGGSNYVEVVVYIEGCRADPCHFSLGVFRNTSDTTLKGALSEQLRQHVDHHRHAQNAEG